VPQGPYYRTTVYCTHTAVLPCTTCSTVVRGL